MSDSTVLTASRGPDSPCVDTARHRVLRRGIAFAMLAVAIAGCSTPGNHFLATELPVQYEAPPNINPSLIDFTQLSGNVSQSHLINAGDVLEIMVASGQDSRYANSLTVRVDERGNALVPELGVLSLAGQSLADAEALLTGLSVQRGLFRAPYVTVTMKQKKTNRILVIGAVKDQGVKNIPPGETDLLSVLFHAGGLEENAGTTVKITNVQTREEVTTPAIANGQAGANGTVQTGYTSAPMPRRNAEIDLVSAVQTGSGSDYYVGDRGVVMVEKREPQSVYVYGLVREPKKIDFPVAEDLHLVGAITLAAGTKSQVADKVFVVRQVPGSDQPIVIEASLVKARHDPRHNPRLAPGDVVSVAHTPATVLLEVVNMIRIGVTSNLATLF